MSGKTPWAGSDRLNQLPPDWPKTRARILKRDGHRCTWITEGKRCPRRATDVDHIKRGNDHRDINLRSLCSPHHRKKSSAEGVEARQRFPRKRESERHPGLTGGG